MAQIVVPIAASADDDQSYMSGTAYGPPLTGGSQFPTTPANAATGAAKQQNAGTFEVQNALLRFDTSLLPDAAAVTSVVLRLYILSNYSEPADARNMTWDWYVWSMPPVDADFAQVAGTSAASGPAVNSLVPNQDNDITLTDTSGWPNVSVSDYTYLRGHVSGGQPAADNYFHTWTCAAYDHATLSASRPRLVVDYTVPSERVIPDAILTATNLSGTVTAIQDDPDADTGVWLVAP